MKILNGDLLDYTIKGYFDVIVHGCNCFHNMGAGIAYSIKNKFPEVIIADKNTKYADKTKLGTYSKAHIVIPNTNINFDILNGYTQYSFGKGINIDYTALRMVFRSIKREYSGKKIGYPKIGAGLALGDWNIISKIIDSELINEDHALVIYNANF